MRAYLEIHLSKSESGSGHSEVEVEYRSKRLVEHVKMFRALELFELEKYKGPGTGPGLKRALEVGCGPSIHVAAMASRVFDELVLGDLGEETLEEIKLWLQKDKQAFDFEQVLTQIAEVETGSPNAQSIAKRVRSRVQALVKCDVTKDPLISDIVHMQESNHSSNDSSNGNNATLYKDFDAVLASLSIESACSTLEQFEDAMVRMAGVLRQGGYLVLLISIEGSYYKYGEKIMPTYNLTNDECMNGLAKAGFTVVQKQVFPRPAVWFSSDWTSQLLILGQKC